LARLIGASPPRFAPADDAESTGLNKRCSNRKLRAELQVTLRFPTIDSGLPDALRDAENGNPSSAF
jgi:hypothetical protein